MGRAKEIKLKVIPSKIANDFVKEHHYSHKVVHNSKIHFGCFLDNKLHGVMSFGSPMDKRKVINLVVDENGKSVKWNDMLELNRMAFDDYLPKNSESHCISIALKLIKRNAPQIKWILSFADGQQCGDGTIYRASGFKLTGFSDGAMWKLPPELAKLNGGEVAHRMKIQNKRSVISKYILRRTNGKNPTMKECVKKFGGQLLEGYNLRYIKILDKEYKLNIPEISFSKIDELNAGMYKGERITRAERHNKIDNK